MRSKRSFMLALAGSYYARPTNVWPILRALTRSVLPYSASWTTYAITTKNLTVSSYSDCVCVPLWFGRVCGTSAQSFSDDYW